MAKYFYARTSTKQQNLARQLAHAEKLNVDRIFTDQCTGTNFDRPGYQEMKELLKEGDEVIVSEFDRFGRGWDAVQPEYEWFREHGVTLTYLNAPQELMDKYAGTPFEDMVEVLSAYVSATFGGMEVENMKVSQREGLDSMKTVKGKKVSARTGKGFGKEPYDVPGFEEAYKRVLAGESRAQDEWERLGISKSKWYRTVKRYNAA